MAWTDAPTTELVVSFVDTNNNHSKVRFWLPGLVTDLAAASVVAITNALYYMTECWLYKVELIPHALNGAAVGSMGGSYGSAADKSRFVWKTTAGSLIRLEIPTLDPAILLPDGETIDQSNTAVAAFLASAKTTLKGPAGEAIQSLVSAVRVRSAQTKTQK
jgi:hypothetical protein